tara:strand:+ start:221 stop:340 length:120 start_codon:yes stop_codon:yes gene_type:complete
VVEQVTRQVLVNQELLELFQLFQQLHPQVEVVELDLEMD